METTDYQKRVKQTIKFALILFVITALELLFAFLWPESVSRVVLVVMFLVMTLAKAYYIVAEFMHLGHEDRILQMSILLPLILALFLIYVLMDEGFGFFAKMGM